MWFSLPVFGEPRVKCLAQFLAFALVGAVGTALHYAVMFACVAALAWPGEAATALGAVCGAGLNYALNYRFTFRSNASHRATASKFMVVAAAAAALNAGAVGLLTRSFAVELWPAQVAATGVLLVGGFLANRAWTFGARPHE